MFEFAKLPDNSIYSQLEKDFQSLCLLFTYVRTPYAIVQIVLNATYLQQIWSFKSLPSNPEYSPSYYGVKKHLVFLDIWHRPMKWIVMKTVFTVYTCTCTIVEISKKYTQCNIYNKKPILYLAFSI